MAYEQWVLQTAMLSLERPPWKTQLTYVAPQRRWTKWGRCNCCRALDTLVQHRYIYCVMIIQHCTHVCCNTARACHNVIPQQIIYVHTPFKQYVLVPATPDHQLQNELNALGLQLPTTSCPPAWPSGIACKWLLSHTH